MTDRDALRKLVERVRNAERWDTDTIADEVAAIVDRLEKLEQENRSLAEQGGVFREIIDEHGELSQIADMRLAQLDVTTSPEADDE